MSKASLAYKDKRGLHAPHVARAMQSSERGLAGNLIDEATLEATLAGGLKGVPNLRPERAARALIEQLVRASLRAKASSRQWSFFEYPRPAKVIQVNTDESIEA